MLILSVLSCPLPAQDNDLNALDKDLLEDLDSDLLEGLGDLPGLEGGDGSQEPQDDAGHSTGDGQPAAEDAGSDDAGGRAVSPLIRISEQMRKAESRISSDDTSEKTQQIQKDILQELAVIIEQMKQQQKQQQQQQAANQKKQQQQKKPGEKPQNGGKPQGSSSDEPSSKPARDSTEDVRKPEDIEAENRELEAMLKEVWGHLPDRVRQQMMNATVEQLLPKYQKLIEEYYKRLAEDRDN